MTSHTLDSGAMANATLPETKHTPGPWAVGDTRYHADGCDRRNIYAEDETFISTVPARSWAAQDEANAALISRAPDLLAENERLREALRALLDSCGARQRYHALDYAAAVENAEVALSEQEGK